MATEAKVTVTGTPENPIFNFEIPQGTKGEPGGLVVPIVAYSGDDANKYTTPGTVYQTSGSTMALNWPIAGKGHLLVIGAPGTVQQIFYPLIPIAASAAKVSYTRVQLNATAWSPWSAFASHRIDNTAGRTIYAWDDTNSREQLVYGDTGWRDISTMLNSDYTSTKVTIRRYQHMVTVNFDSVKSVTESGHSIWLTPTGGFKPDVSNGIGNLRYALASDLNGGNTKVISPETNSGGIRFLSYTKDTALNGSFTYFTRDPWPTTLPGTAIGTIPNL